MSKNILVALKSLHGFDTIVPVCDTAKVFAAIGGMSTLTKPAIDKIKQLGYNVKVQQEMRSI